MGLIKKILKFNSFFSKRKTLEENKIILPSYTKAIFKDKKYQIGDFTYGVPNILFDDQDANLTIGKFCSIAHNVTIFLGGNHRTDWVSTYPFNVLNDEFPNAKNIIGHPATKGHVIIGNDVWIGNNVTIMSGLKISDGAVIGTGAVITKDVGPYEIWVGNPAKMVKKRFSDENINQLIELKWWDWEIEKINENTGFLCSPFSNENFTQLKNQK